jgi:hypothetical protein
MSRRAFLAGAGTGLVGGAALTWFGLNARRQPAANTPAPNPDVEPVVEANLKQLAMPGPFPGRVVEVYHPGSVKANQTIDAPSVKKMMDRGMVELTGAENPVEAWRRFFEKDDVVGIKVNPVGMKSRSEVVGAISSPQVLLEVVAGLSSAGVKPQNIILFERYASEFRQAGYEAVLRERAMDGVQWYASSANGGSTQVDLNGYDNGEARDPHVVGYDRDVYFSAGYCHPAHDPKDDRRFRSHLSAIVTKLVNKFITIPVLKDHRSAGVTLALKNLSHGLNNNVARTHLSDITVRDGTVSGPNQCDTFIPTAVAQLPTRQKATLHILDGLIGVYEGGPGSWNRTWSTWPYKSLFFATDPVAMDHVGWDIIDAKRAKEGWPPVAQMGLLQNTRAVRVARQLAALGGSNPTGRLTLQTAGAFYEGGSQSESFDRRQPEHIILAGTIGLGVFDRRKIDHRRIALTV